MDADFIAGMTAPIEYDHRALLLDDDDANRMLLSVALQMGALPFSEARSGKEALDLWSPGKFAFAFLDIDLPDIKGIEVGRHIREKDKGIAIIMCSANDDPTTMAQALEIDCDMFFIKPFELHTLLNTIRTIDRAALRANPRILIVDNTQRPRWENRLGAAAATAESETTEDKRKTKPARKIGTGELKSAAAVEGTSNVIAASEPSSAQTSPTPAAEAPLPVEAAPAAEAKVETPSTSQSEAASSVEPKIAETTEPSAAPNPISDINQPDAPTTGQTPSNH
ncbi:MAG: hypothetical protein OHK0023_21130 [Anaerolineae bacterium]